LLYGNPFNRFTMAFTNTVAVFKLTVELAAFFTSRKRYGFRYPEEGEHDRLYTFTQVFSGTVHASEQDVRLVAEAMQCSCDERDSLLPCHERDVHTVGRNAVIHPGSEIGFENKRWPVERYNTVVKKLVERGYTVTILLGPAEIDLEERFEKHEHVQIVVEPSSVALIELFRSACLFIGNDSGPAHIAAFFGVPTVVLFGPVQPERSGPRTASCKAIYNAIDCSPCHFSAQGCADNKCMQSITVERVLREIE
jgi:ADP-heptose:LPS heptosyltransferase